MKDLSLKGKKVFLTNVEDRVKFLNCNFLSKNEEKNVYMNLLIFLQNPKQEIGYLSCYNYNKIDGYIYIDVFLYEEQKEDVLIESCILLLNYLFTCFPIRKVYYQTNDYLLEKLSIKILKKLNFKLEANLKNDVFYDGRYCNKYILALYKNEYKEVLNEK